MTITSTAGPASAGWPPPGCTPTPDGWCACCGHHPAEEGDLHRLIHQPTPSTPDGMCGYAPHAQPEDPADFMSQAVWEALNDLGLPLRFAVGGPALAARLRAHVLEVLDLHGC